MITNDLMEKIVSLAKRRGFVYPGSEIYGGLANTYEYGPLGVELKKNITDLWWRRFVRERRDMVGLDSSVILHPRVWEASGHVANFNDMLVDCRHCNFRTRADHLVANFFESRGEEMNVEGKPEPELDKLIADWQIPCPECGQFAWTETRKFNQLFETKVGIVPEAQSKVYLRGETAQGIFAAFKNITDSTRVKLPFGVGQTGKSFRNEITKGNFIFRTLEFEQAELEYFFDPETSKWEELYEQWKTDIWNFVTHDLGVRPEHLRWRPHTDEERSFYSTRTEDLEYEFPFGWKELWGLAYRTDYDLGAHMRTSGVDLRLDDPATGRKILPHVIEPAVGLNRLMAMVMLEAYMEEPASAEASGGQGRKLMKLSPRLAPYKVAVFPLLANKPELVAKAESVYEELAHSTSSGHAILPIAWDDRGNIGKRYYAQDEIGTPWCITVDFQTLEDDTVTIRSRDTATQERIALTDLAVHITQSLA